MAPHQDDRERHGSHPLQEWTETPERYGGQDTAERLEMDRVHVANPWSWADLKEAVYVIGALLGFVLTGCATYYGVVGEMREQKRDNQEVAARVTILEQGRALNVPRLEEQIRLNSLQDQRIQNLTDALSSLRTTVTDLARIVSGQAELLHDADKREAVLEERLGHIGPHDR